MEKKEAQDLVKAISSLVTVIKEQNKIIDKQNQLQRESIDTMKNFNTRLVSLSNAISEGSVLNNH